MKMAKNLNKELENRVKHLGYLQKNIDELVKDTHKVIGFALVYDTEVLDTNESETKIRYVGNINHCSGLAHRMVKFIEENQS